MTHDTYSSAYICFFVNDFSLHPLLQGKYLHFSLKHMNKGIQEQCQIAWWEDSIPH